METQRDESKKTLPSDEDVSLERLTLHKAGIATAGLSPEQVRQRFGEHTAAASRRSAEKRLDEAARAEVVRATCDEERRLKREAQRVEALQRDLRARNISADGLSADEMVGLLKDAVQREQGEKLFVAAKCPRLQISRLDEINEQKSPKWAEVRDLLVTRMQYADGFLVALLGISGPGKTQIGVSVIQSACQALMTARYIRALDLFTHIRRAYTPRPRGEAGLSDADLIEPFFKYDLLVIDECHQRSESDFEQNMLSNLLDHRYGDMRCTIMIANQSKEEFARSVGSSITSRIHECGEAIMCDWPSFRRPGSWRNPRPTLRVPSGAERRPHATVR